MGFVSDQEAQKRYYDAEIIILITEVMWAQNITQYILFINWKVYKTNIILWEFLKAQIKLQRWKNLKRHKEKVVQTTGMLAAVWGLRTEEDIQMMNMVNILPA